MIEAAEDQRLIEGHRHVGCLRREDAARTKEDDVVCADLFEAQEVVRAVLDERPAEREAELLARIRVLLQVELALLAQRIVTEEAEDRALEHVRAGLGDDRERAACRAADLGVEAVADDAELADGVLREAGARETEHGVGEVDAVHEDGRLAGVAAGADDGLVLDEPVAAALALHAGRQVGQLLEVATGNGQFLDLLGDDVGRGVGLVDVHERDVADDVDRLGHLRDLERDGELEGLADAEGESLLRAALEAREFDLDRVRARLEGEGAGAAGAVGHEHGREAGVGLRDGDGDPWQDLVGLVDGNDFNHAVCHLCVCDRRTPGQHGDQRYDEAADAAASECNESAKHVCLP